MQLLSVVSHSCVLAHALPRTWKVGSPALSTTTLHGSMGVGSEVLEEGQDFWNGGSQDRVGGGVQGRQITKQPGRQLNIASDKHH